MNTLSRRLVFTRFGDGERYPLLLNRNGMPEWYPTLFITSRYRNGSRAFNTAHAALAAISRCLRWADDSQIDLIERFARRQFLQTHEIEGLTGYLREREKKDSLSISSRPARSTGLEVARAMAPKKSSYVTSGFAYSRITYTARYIEWLARRILEEAAKEVDKESGVRIASMTKAILDKRPAVGGKGSKKAKRAQPREEESYLKEIIQPHHAENPFSESTARRNLLILMVLDQLGLRAGELLSIKVQDIDFAAQEIVIPRRHHDPSDPRIRQPSVKTMDRRLHLSDELTLLLTNYVLKDRHKYPLARHHPMLFVSTRGSRDGKAGNPLSRAALSKVTDILTNRMPKGSERIHPHLLRHNAATRAFAQLNELGTSEARIEQIMEWMFGWASGSGTARTYIVTELERQAKVVQRELQNRWRVPNRD